jgi:hypothetical protein
MNPSSNIGFLETAAVASARDIAPSLSMDECLVVLSEAQRSHLNKHQCSKAVDDYCRATLSFAGVEHTSSESPLSVCFSQAPAPNKRLQIAVCLLRLLCTYPKFVTEDGMDPGRLSNLFDESLAGPMYAQAKISKSDQTFQKQEALSNLLQSHENELAAAVKSLGSLQQLGTFRQSYLKKMRSSLSKLLIQPMLPEGLGDQRIDGLVGAVQSYLDADNPDVVRLYEEAHSKLKAYVQDAEGTRIHYLQRYCVAVALNLQTLLTVHFEATPFSQPAELRPSLGGKKYPLCQDGARFEIVLEVLNTGPGFAHEVKVEINPLDDLEIEQSAIRLGGMHPTSTTILVPARVTKASETSMIEVICIWRNQDGVRVVRSEPLELSAQRSDIDWARAATEDPYSLAPVRTADELIGRTEILNRLMALTKGATVESAYIRGQKRVGKTSIARALTSRLLSLFPSEYIVVYLEAGDYVTDNGRGTIQSLGLQICKAVVRSDPRFLLLALPTFEGALSPITDFLQDALSKVPGCRMLFILDEFDELPMDLYRRGLVGDAFFRTLRSISNKDQFGFVLVGSEKMEFVLSCQGDALNKFVRIGVDYFDQQQSWNDFQDLIRRPTTEYLEFDERAVTRVYEWCAGNPYFAKLICQALFQMMVERRDSHVTSSEVDRAVDRTLAQIGSNSFQHFWQDAISESAPRSEEISIIRRKVLLALGECLRRSSSVALEEIIQASRNFGLSELIVRHEIREYERRNVLISRGNTYSCKVRLFSDWLASRGIQEIMTTFVDHDSLILLKQQQERARVQDKEILSLTNTWGMYQGRRVTPADVRVWLDQFAQPEEQRLIFRILQSLLFYATDRIREKMEEAHRIVMRGTTWRRVRGQPRRRDVIVSAFGGMSKSGSEYAKRYADENQIFQDNVVSIGEIIPTLRKREEIQAVVFLDDFIGTGQTLFTHIQSAEGMLRELILLRPEIRLFVICVAGFTEGQKLIEKEIGKLDLPLSLYVCDSLDDRCHLFSKASDIFDSETEREQAKDIAYAYGSNLVANAPLGYGDGEAAIVFDNTIPNNCLPIFWQKSKDWTPLFPRR